MNFTELNSTSNSTVPGNTGVKMQVFKRKDGTFTFDKMETYPIENGLAVRENEPDLKLEISRIEYFTEVIELHSEKVDQLFVNIYLAGEFRNGRVVVMPFHYFVQKFVNINHYKNIIKNTLF